MLPTRSSAATRTGALRSEPDAPSGSTQSFASSWKRPNTDSITECAAPNQYDLSFGARLDESHSR
jgi:hypothetical protein